MVVISTWKVIITSAPTITVFVATALAALYIPDGKLYFLTIIV